MRKIKLNSAEKNEYNSGKNMIPSLPTIFYFKDMFPGRVTSARIGRKFFEDVKSKQITGVSLVGSRAKEGYKKIPVNL